MSCTWCFIDLNHSWFSPLADDSVVVFVVVNWDRLMHDVSNFLDGLIKCFLLFIGDNLKILDDSIELVLLSNEIFASIGLIFLLSLTDLLSDGILLFLSVFKVKLGLFSIKTKKNKVKRNNLNQQAILFRDASIFFLFSLSLHLLIPFLHS